MDKDYLTNTSLEKHPIFFRLSSNIPQVSKLLFSAKLPVKNDRFSDLELFRQEIEQSKAGLHHQPYTNNKKNVFFYKCMFFGFAFLFFVLGLISMHLPTTISFGLLFSACTFLKGGIMSVCFLLSLGAFIFALTLRPEKEAILQSVRRAKIHLKSILTRREIRMGLKRFIVLFGSERLQAATLRHMYQECLDKINDKKDEFLHLSRRIVTAETLDRSEKETLLNQAIEELEEKLLMLVHSFRHTALPPFHG